MLLDRNHEISLDKIRGLGFTKELPVGHGYFKAFDHMVQEKILPFSSRLYILVRGTSIKPTSG